MRLQPARVVKALVLTASCYIFIQSVAQWRNAASLNTYLERDPALRREEVVVQPIPDIQDHERPSFPTGGSNSSAGAFMGNLPAKISGANETMGSWPDQSFMKVTTPARWQSPEKCPPDMHYMAALDLKTALPSPPGAGNTWVRHLLQLATGVYTGSIYSDGQLRQAGFPGEGKRDGSVIAVKMHESGPAVHNNYDRAIVIVRNPYESIVAEYNRQHGGHTKVAKPESFKGKRWERFLAQQHLLWILILRPWLVDYDRPTHIVDYSRLKTDIRSEVRTMVNFLEWNVTDTQLDCIAGNSEGRFHRKKDPLPFDPFDVRTRRILDHYYKLVSEWPANRHNRTAWFDVIPAHW